MGWFGLEPNQSGRGGYKEEEWLDLDRVVKEMVSFRGDRLLGDFAL